MNQVNGRVRPGMKIRSNDPRDGGKTVEVLSVELHHERVRGINSWFAVYQAGKRKASVRVDRIHEPGYTGKTGWTIVPAEQQPKGGWSVEKILAHAEPAVSGQGGHARTYAAVNLLIEAGVSEPVALPALMAYYNPRCVPPWDRDELATLVATAYRYRPGAAEQQPKHGIPQGSEALRAGFTVVDCRGDDSCPCVISGVPTSEG